MLYVILLVTLFLIFRNWFTFLPISSGDLSFFNKEYIVTYLNPPFMWETFRNLGFGGDSFLNQGVYFYNFSMGVLGRFFDYSVIERIIWFFPILIGGFISPLILARYLKIFPGRFYPLTVFLYFLNTYFFIIMAGGQLTVVFGYLAIPIAFSAFINSIRSKGITSILLFSLILTALFFFDFRLAYIFLIVVLFYMIFSIITSSDFIGLMKRYSVVAFVSCLVLLGTHAYWLLPYTLYFHSPTASVKEAYISTNAVSYFSFAKFENTIALFHPLWPDNIFGKVGFMKPEFLLMPILAFSSLLFLSRKPKTKSEKLPFKSQNPKVTVTTEWENRFILFFALLGLSGAFLAKGTNPPFGEIYSFAFNHIPGFFMFRDSTKWYTLTALSYSILIPFSIWKIYDWLKERQKFRINTKNKLFNVQNVFLIAVIAYILFLIRPAILGQLGGTLKIVEVPKEYSDYKNFLLSNKRFSRVLWVPTMQRFTFYSNTHPAIPARDFFNAYNKYAVIKIFQKNDIEKILQESSIQYIVVPDDTQKEIYIKDRKYDPQEYEKTLEALRQITWLKETGRFGKIIVFELANVKDHFWSTSKDIQINNSLISPTHYMLQIKNAKKGDQIVFSEFYDKYWYMNDGEHIVHSNLFNTTFNSFILEKPGNYSAKIWYKPQELELLGLTITGFSLVVIIGAFIGLYRKK